MHPLKRGLVGAASVFRETVGHGIVENVGTLRTLKAAQRWTASVWCW
jgi:hypothetical protein